MPTGSGIPAAGNRGGRYDPLEGNSMKSPLSTFVNFRSNPLPAARVLNDERQESDWRQADNSCQGAVGSDPLPVPRSGRTFDNALHGTACLHRRHEHGCHYRVRMRVVPTPRALALCAFQSVGHTLLTLAKGGSAHNRGAPDRTDGNLSLYPPWALAQSSCPSIRLRRRLLGSICQSGVVRGVGRPARSVVRNANVLSVCLAVHVGLARRLVDQGLWGVRGVLW